MQPMQELSLKTCFSPCIQSSISAYFHVGVGFVPERLLILSAIMAGYRQLF